MELEKRAKELFLLENKGVISCEEARTHLKAIERYYRRTTNTGSLIDDYLRLVESEDSFALLIRQRMSKLVDWEKYVFPSLLRAYRSMLVRFPKEYKAHEIFLKFCANYNLKKHLSRTAATSLSLFPNSKDLYILISKLFLEYDFELKISRTIILRGIRKFPSCLSFWKSLVEIDLKSCKTSPQDYQRIVASLIMSEAELNLSIDDFKQLQNFIDGNNFSK